MATTTKNRVKKVLARKVVENGKVARATKTKAAPGPKKAKAGKESETKLITIPPLQQKEMAVTIRGDRPLLVNNKMSVAEDLDEVYGGEGGKTGKVKPRARTPDEQYAGSFYVLPDSKYPAPDPRGRYGVPASGIKKCICAAVGLTGTTNNTDIGRIQKSFYVMEDAGGLCLIKGTPVRDRRMTQPKNMTVPKMAHRARWDEWEINLRIKFNPLVLSEESVVNLLMHAGQYIGLCEMRAEKKQGSCGGFVVDIPKGK